MGWNDHLDDFDFIEECPFCKKKFQVTETEQIPGFRCKEDMVCPYCKKVVRSSMEYEFTTYKI